LLELGAPYGAHSDIGWQGASPVLDYRDASATKCFDHKTSSGSSPTALNRPLFAHSLRSSYWSWTLSCYFITKQIYIHQNHYAQTLCWSPTSGRSEPATINSEHRHHELEGCGTVGFWKPKSFWKKQSQHRSQQELAHLKVDSLAHRSSNLLAAAHVFV